MLLAGFCTRGGQPSHVELAQEWGVAAVGVGGGGPCSRSAHPLSAHTSSLSGRPSCQHSGGPRVGGLARRGCCGQEIARRADGRGGGRHTHGSTYRMRRCLCSGCGARNRWSIAGRLWVPGKTHTHTHTHETIPCVFAFRPGLMYFFRVASENGEAKTRVSRCESASCDALRRVFDPCL